MPVQACSLDGKPGFRWGTSGKVYQYTPGDEAGAAEAKRKAYVQGYAIGKAAGMPSWFGMLADMVGACFRNAEDLGVAEVETESQATKVRGFFQVGPRNFEYSVKGPFPGSLTDLLAPPVSDNAFVGPFTTAVEPQCPTGVGFETPEDAWKWGSAKAPLFVSPRLPGFRGILEKKGGSAKLRYEGDTGVDQLSKFLPLKEFVIRLPDDFVFEVLVTIEKDGKYAAQPEQDKLSLASAFIAEGETLRVMLCDMLYLNADVHELSLDQRVTKMAEYASKSLATAPEFLVLPRHTVADQSQMNSAIDWARDYPRVLGAAVEIAAAPYSMTGQTSQVIFLGDERLEEALGIMKQQADQRIVTGVVLRPNMIDSQGDSMTPQDVEQAAHYYMENARVTGLRHKQKMPGAVLESYIAPAEFKLGKGMVKKGDWVLSMRIDDESVWEKVLSGEYRAFSVGGFGTRQDA